MDYREFNNLSPFGRLVVQSYAKIDEAVYKAPWTNPGDDLRGTLFLKGQPVPPFSWHGTEPATAYELVCFSQRPRDGARAIVDWKKYDLVVAPGSTYKLRGRTLYLCLRQNGTFVSKSKGVLKRRKTAELLVAP